MILESVDISRFLTLGIGGTVDFYAAVETESEILEALSFARAREIPLHVVAGGSNIVFPSSRVRGVLLHVRSRGLEILAEDESEVLVRVAAGENWDEFVQYAMTQCWWGCENMSLIPGTVGALPIQNVGAYGQESKDLIENVNCLDLQTSENRVFSNSECQFSFRRSIFNTSFAGRFLVTSVDLRLSKIPKPNLARPELSKLRGSPLGSEQLQRAIRATVVAARTNGVNLPSDPNAGSCGTFFRTCEISSKLSFAQLAYRVFVSYGLKPFIMVVGFGWRYRSKSGFRLPSRFLLNLAGLGGASFGSVRLMQSNPAVVVSDLNGSPSSADLHRLIMYVQSTMEREIGRKLPIEPHLVFFSDYEV